MTKIHDLAERVQKLSPADRLRLAAGLLEQSRPELARPLIDQVSGELAIVLLISQTHIAAGK